MSRDFTLEKYTELMQSLKSNYKIVRVCDYFSIPKGEDFIAILRHDVDKYPERATRMALLENRMGIHSTYYFRWNPKISAEGNASNVQSGRFPERYIRETQLHGHEVGYHYENLSELKDKEKALADFSRKLSIFRQFANVQTVAMHGSPRVRVRNADMLIDANFAAYGLLGEPHISSEFKNIVYVSDSGRMWSSGAGSVRDTLGISTDERVLNTDELIYVLSQKKYRRLMISAHPQRWSVGTGEWMSELVGQNVKNIGKKMLK